MPAVHPPPANRCGTSARRSSSRRRTTTVTPTDEASVRPPDHLRRVTPDPVARAPSGGGRCGHGDVRAGRLPMIWARLAAYLTKRPPWAQAVVLGLCVGLLVAAGTEADTRDPLIS